MVVEPWKDWILNCVIKEFLIKVGNGEMPINHQIMYQMQDIFNLLPDISHDNFTDTLHQD